MRTKLICKVLKNIDLNCTDIETMLDKACNKAVEDLSIGQAIAYACDYFSLNEIAKSLRCSNFSYNSRVLLSWLLYNCIYEEYQHNYTKVYADFSGSYSLRLSIVNLMYEYLPVRAYEEVKHNAGARHRKIFDAMR